MYWLIYLRNEHLDWNFGKDWWKIKEMILNASHYLNTVDFFLSNLNFRSHSFLLDRGVIDSGLSELSRRAWTQRWNYLITHSLSSSWVQGVWWKKIEKVTFKDETWKHQKEQDIYKSQHDKSMEIVADLKCISLE